MSYASLVGLPEANRAGNVTGTTAIDHWHSVRSELDMSDEPVAALPDAMWELGEQPTDEFFEDSDGDTEVLVIQYHGGSWVARHALPVQPFPCENECSGCRVGRIAARTFGEDSAVEHLL
jgi:hypothetical protein